MGYIGTEIPEHINKIFQIAREARDTALQLVIDRFADNIPVHGWEVDDACRNVIVKAGYGKYFIHRTGHNIAEEVHGNGTHIDNLETKDERIIIKGSCFSIEPGIYMPDDKIGFRTEIDAFVTDEGNIEVVGAIQENIVKILSL
jgi:Xaa-Pro aminopeptidase